MAFRAVISGASSGLGLALAQHYLKQGAVVGIMARRAHLLQALVDQFLPSNSLLPLEYTVRQGCSRFRPDQAWLG